MIKIIVHTPKGGVGKTTFATNIALFLARQGKRVWALDLAQGAMMTRFLEQTEEFSTTFNKIDTNELSTIPEQFRGAQNFDFLVADTDDYVDVLAEFANETKIRGWRIIVPIVNEYIGLIRISDEIREVMVANMIRGHESPNIKMFVNRFNDQNDYDVVHNILREKQLDSLLSCVYVEECDITPPFLIDNESFRIQIERILEEMGIVL